MRSFLTSSFTFCALLLALQACTQATPAPDKHIRVVSSFDGTSTIAIPPECEPWNKTVGDRYDNQSWSRYGCAQARNLAAQIANPEDLVAPRPLGSADAVKAGASVRDYRAGKSQPLIDPNADAPAQINVTNSGSAPD